MEFSTPKKDINIKHFWTNIDPQVIIKNYGNNLIEKNRKKFPHTKYAHLASCLMIAWGVECFLKEKG